MRLSRVSACASDSLYLERTTRFELATLTLARCSAQARNGQHGRKCA